MVEFYVVISMLKINNLSVKINEQIILENFSLTINMGEVHAVMGPNGIGKSTICKTIMGEPNYQVTGGSISYQNEDLLKMNITERARLGIFLLSQNPIEIPGVTNAEMLRIALSEKTGSYVSIFEFNKKMEAICEKLVIPKSFIHRGINEGMSGGERKKNELLHLWMLEPSLILLDELDSGLDVDSLKVVCASINEYRQTHECAILIISHHPELLKLLDCTHVHILGKGVIVESGNLALALKIEAEGYQGVTKANNVSELEKHE